MTSVLITGASKGIGRGLAAEFAARGYRVIATARDPRTLDDLDVDQRLSLDVTDAASVATAVAQAGEVDLLVSNAGVIFYSAVEAIPLDAFEQLLARNTVGALRVAQAVLPQMRERGHGRLLFMSSVAGRHVLGAGAAYAASKWALEAIVEGMAAEIEPFGLQAALLEPGPVSSGALDDVQRYSVSDDPDPYAELTNVVRDPSTFMTVQQVATEVADAAEADPLPLRIPVGDGARRVLLAAG
jgi:NADP-dependent 3-hydroxy acid dehydrogenase YdfG